MRRPRTPPGLEEAECAAVSALAHRAGDAAAALYGSRRSVRAIFHRWRALTDPELADGTETTDAALATAWEHEEAAVAELGLAPAGDLGALLLKLVVLQRRLLAVLKPEEDTEVAREMALLASLLGDVAAMLAAPEGLAVALPWQAPRAPGAARRP